MTEQTLNDLQAAVLPWAREHHPDKYDLTLKVAGNPKSFRSYLLRLLEIRYEEDVAGRGELPILALDETSLVIRVRDNESGEVWEFQGKRATGNRIRSIAELAMPKDEWKKLEATRKILDLEYV